MHLHTSGLVLIASLLLSSSVLSAQPGTRRRGTISGSVTISYTTTRSALSICEEGDDPIETSRRIDSVTFSVPMYFTLNFPDVDKQLENLKRMKRNGQGEDVTLATWISGTNISAAGRLAGGVDGEMGGAIPDSFRFNESHRTWGSNPCNGGGCTPAKTLVETGQRSGMLKATGVSISVTADTALMVYHVWGGMGAGLSRENYGISTSALVADNTGEECVTKWETWNSNSTDEPKNMGSPIGFPPVLGATISRTSRGTIRGSRTIGNFDREVYGMAAIPADELNAWMRNPTRPATFTGIFRWSRETMGEIEQTEGTVTLELRP